MNHGKSHGLSWFSFISPIKTTMFKWGNNMILRLIHLSYLSICLFQFIIIFSSHLHVQNPFLTTGLSVPKQWCSCWRGFLPMAPATALQSAAPEWLVSINRKKDGLWWNILSGWWFQPLWKIWKSVGIIIPNIWKIKKSPKPPTINMDDEKNGVPLWLWKASCYLKESIKIYHLVNVYVTMENHQAINGKINYFDWAIFNSKSVKYYTIIWHSHLFVNPLVQPCKVPLQRHVCWHKSILQWTQDLTPSQLPLSF